MNWMPTFLHGRSDIDYTGYDLLPVNIETAREKFKNETWKFETFDLVKDRISKNMFYRIFTIVKNLFQETSLTF